MNNFERKFGKYAIPNLSLMLILCYGMGYIIKFVNSGIFDYFTLNPYAILRGQVWRLFTWLVVPPTDTNIFFVLIMLFFYYSIGTSLERTWGDFKYNVYILGGMLFTIIGAFLLLVFVFLFYCGGNLEVMNMLAQRGLFNVYASAFSTYYINMSIFLAYACTYPDMRVLLYFIIPIKVKWMGIVYGVFMLIEGVQAFRAGAYYVLFAMGASLLNFLIFFLRQKKGRMPSPRQKMRQAHFNREMNAGRNRNNGSNIHSFRAFGDNPKTGGSGDANRTSSRTSIHKCAICGRTEITHPDSSFRFCTKCNGNYEYCEEHLFTHVHIQ